MCVLNTLLKSIIYMCPMRKHCIAVRYIFNERKQHINETNIKKAKREEETRISNT